MEKSVVATLAVFIYCCHGNHTAILILGKSPGLDIENVNQFKQADIKNLIPGQSLYNRHQVEKCNQHDIRLPAANTGMQSNFMTVLQVLKADPAV